MKFTKLYNETIKLWPTTINIEDGKLIGNEGGFFPALKTSWDNAEVKSDNLSEWHALMVWAIYGDFHDQAKRNKKNGISEITVSALNLKNVEKIFTESLFSSDTNQFDDIKNEYENDLKP